jgi:microsomal dipeptidase-like Zn-dependent dipeptidase
MSHLLHLIKVAGENGYEVQKALTQICIGSDFDGLINPVWCCRNVTALQVFKAELIRYFPRYAKNNRDAVSLPEGFNIRVFAEQLFFENGRDFLMKRLALLNPVID